MIRKVVCFLIVFLMNLMQVNTAWAQELLTISVFEHHDKYVEASRSYGLSWKILDFAARRAGVRLQAQESTWEGSLRRLKGGKVDLVFLAIKSPERAQWASFSVPMISTGSAIFTYKDNPVSSIEEVDLVNSLIGVSADSLQERFARELGFKNIYASLDRPQLYKMLESGRLDYLFFSAGVVDFYCVFLDPSETRDCLKQVGEYYDQGTAHIIAMKNDIKVNRTLKKLDRSIRNIADSSYIKNLFKSYDLTEEDHARWLSLLSASQ